LGPGCRVTWCHSSGGFLGGDGGEYADPSRIFIDGVAQAPRKRRIKDPSRRLDAVCNTWFSSKFCDWCGFASELFARVKRVGMRSGPGRNVWALRPLRVTHDGSTRCFAVLLPDTCGTKLGSGAQKSPHNPNRMPRNRVTKTTTPARIGTNRTTSEAGMARTVPDRH
jgi:hypothetical protein